MEGEKERRKEGLEVWEGKTEGKEAGLGEVKGWMEGE